MKENLDLYVSRARSCLQRTELRRSHPRRCGVLGVAKAAIWKRKLQQEFAHRPPNSEQTQPISHPKNSPATLEINFLLKFHIPPYLPFASHPSPPLSHTPHFTFSEASKAPRNGVAAAGLVAIAALPPLPSVSALQMLSLYIVHKKSHHLPTEGQTGRLLRS